MGILFLIVFFLVSLFIVGLVLLQEGKGGGLTGMSAGMDGVMGAKNPLRRMTAYLFIAFVVMCLAINMYFHSREDTSLPVGIPMTGAPSAVEEIAREAVPEGSLRPTEAVEAVEAAAAGAVEAAGDAAESVATDAAAAIGENAAAAGDAASETIDAATSAPAGE